tara:strand:- start:437 stop:733 length:297 start_codon:yes stop_codon:yes gene_type:complete
MIKKLSIILLLMFLTSCAQNVAILGPTLSYVSTGSVGHAIMSGVINTGVKHETGKDVSEHVVQSLDKPLDCTLANSNELDAVFFNDYGNFDCHLVENQ